MDDLAETVARLAQRVESLESRVHALEQPARALPAAETDAAVQQTLAVG